MHLTRFCFLQMDLPFLEASAVRFVLEQGGGVLLTHGEPGGPFLLAVLPNWLPGTYPFSLCRTGERPDLCRVTLPEFQQFLLEFQGVWWGRSWGRVQAEQRSIPDLRPSPPHQELWAVDRLQVQEFMLSFLRDPLREIEEPYFFLDEVSPTLLPFS